MFIKDEGNAREEEPIGVCKEEWRHRVVNKRLRIKFTKELTGGKEQLYMDNLYTQHWKLF